METDDNNKIIVTTIQKLNKLMKAEESLPIYQKQVVFIFDEFIRSIFRLTSRSCATILVVQIDKWYLLQFGRDQRVTLRPAQGDSF
jgi:hypothetical protein